MGHWYKTDGTLVDGADLRQARKDHLFPSVTTILDILDKPGLTKWKLQVGADEAERVGAETSAEGARLHELISRWINIYMVEDFVRPLELPGDDWETAAAVAEIAEDDVRLLGPTLEWMNENISRTPLDPVMSEISLTHQSGYAGTIDVACHDMEGRRMIIDMKTRDIHTAPKRVKKYFEHGMQLGGYESLIDPSMADEHRWITLVINRDPDNPMCVPLEWSKKDKVRARRAFVATVMVWQAIKDFDPAIP